MTARVAKDHLRAFIERIERLEEEKKALADDIRDVYAEAKAHGFDTKALRTIVSLRKQDVEERKEHEAILETYMQALGMLDGHYAGEPGPAEVQKRTGPSQRTQAERDAINERAANWKRPTRRSTSRPCVARSQTITSSASRPLLEGRHAETGAPSLAVEERDGAPDLSPRHVRPLRMPGPRPGHSVRSPPDPGGGVSSLPRPSG